MQSSTNLTSGSNNGLYQTIVQHYHLSGVIDGLQTLGDGSDPPGETL